MESTSTNRNQNQSQNRGTGQLIDNLGADHLGWSPAFADYKQILEQLKSKDEMLIYDAVMNLSQQLSVAQENTLSNFTLDQYIPALIDILKTPGMSDIMFAVQCLTNLMDIFPTICNSIINHGGVKCICELLERSMGFIDLNEACIKAFEKISFENPYSILTSGALSLSLNMMDFFEQTTQKRIIQTLLNVSRHSASETDFDEYIMPIMPCISMLIQIRNDSSEGRCESLSQVILRICESFMRYYSPHSQFDKVNLQYEKLQATGIFETIIQSLYEFSIVDQAYKQSLNSGTSASSGQMQQQQKTMSTVTVQSFLKALTLCSKFSSNVTKQLIEYNVFKLIDQFLPSQDDLKKQNFSSDQYPFILESISLLDVVFPERESTNTQSNVPQTTYQKSESENARLLVEIQKRELFIPSNGIVDQQKIGYIAEKILPKIFQVYENNIVQNIRIKTLQIIDKMLTLFNEELLNNFIEPYSFAKFIYANCKSQHPNSILLCLQMVQKLMSSNPKTYTLPLMREGVSEFIKKIQDKEGLEKTLNIKIASLDSKDTTGDIRNLEEEAHQILQAKAALLSSSQPGDEQQRVHFEQILQRYIEAAKASKGLEAALGTGKVQQEMCNQIITFAQNLNNNYFENEQFMAQINEHCAEEYKLLHCLKQLAQQILELSYKVEFDFNQTKDLMQQLSSHLTNNRLIMCYEFKQSGLLEALEIFLTYTPNMAKFVIEQKKALEKGEELKHSEEMQINTMMKDGKKISKKESRCYLQRMKIFAHCVLNKVNNKSPFSELVHLCHDLLSQSEGQIFEGVQNEGPNSSIPPNLGGGAGSLYSGATDINASVNALKQLTRRTKVNLIYDQNKKVINKLINEDQQKQIQNPPSSLPNFSDAFEQSPMIKSKSNHPVFAMLGETQEPSHSKVYMKRNFLYSELKQVLISVEQCASLYLLEDFLRNKIKSADDVKSLKLPPSFLDSVSRTQKSKAARQVLDKAMEKMREIFEGTFNSRQRTQSDELAQVLAEEILNAKDLSDIEQADIVRQLEIQALQMMDEIYANEDNALDEMRESLEDRLISGQSEEENQAETEQKIYEFQRSIEKLRTTFREKKVQQQKQQLQEARRQGSNMSGLGGLDPSLPVFKEKDLKDIPFPVLSKDADMEDMSEDIRRSEEDLLPSAYQSTPPSNTNVLDVEMTDEEDEHKRELEELALQVKIQQQQKELLKSKTPEIELSTSADSGAQVKEVINQDLEDLIKANGEDIEFEFYLMGGQQLGQNQTLFEIQKLIQGMNNEESSIKSINKKSLYYTYGGAVGSDTATIYFTIRDKHEDLSISRKDSILDFAQKRERTRSEAVNDISVSSVNYLVQQLIDKEFQVFNQSQSSITNIFSQSSSSNLLLGQNKNQKYQTDDFHILEQSLKILKVLNFICKNMHLLTNQGIKFLINHNIETEELKEEGFQDFDLQVALSQIHPNIFHHHKLDSFILKNIQDPYNLIGGAISDTLQQIFRNCPFLFPFQTRQLFFKLISFIGAIDMNRSIYFLRQFLKQRGGKLSMDEKNGVKFSKQKALVDRNRILDSAMSLMKQLNKRSFLEIEYKEEIGTGLGPTLEFYCLLADEIKNLKVSVGGQQNPIQYELWRKGVADNTLFPAPIAMQKLSNEEMQKVYENFRLTGTMIAKSIVDDRLIDLPISPLWWDILLGKKMNIFDLDRLDKEFYKVFADLQLIANKKREIDKQNTLDVDSKMRQIHSLTTSVSQLINFKKYVQQQGAHVEDLSLYFTLPGYDHIELKPNGKDLQVTIHNLQEFIDLFMHFTFHETIKIQTSAFKKGFNSIFPIESLKPFSTVAELEDMICGTQRNDDDWKNIQKLTECVVPAHGYHSKSQEYLNFLRFISELEYEERRKFLRFVTGSPRLPNGGFASLEPKLTVVMKKGFNPLENPDSVLPSVMTCQNYVKLPSYSSYEVMKSKFEMAYNEGSNNFTLS